MNTRNLRMPATLLSLMAASSLITTGLAQQVTAAKAPNAPKVEESVKLEKFVVTGSLIKRIGGETALPVQTFTVEDIEQRGIASAEQLIMELNINGNGLDNLASNADVVDGAQRGNNGASSANLRMQGAGATLVLLNGRRVASHGLNGGVVDLNSIPFAAIERVEVLKDGASATYGTDAVGGVINFILKSNYQGLAASAATDITEQGGGNITRYSLVAGVGDINRDKYNFMASLARSEHKVLRGDQRDFVNTFQPNRGLSPDTTGTPIATVWPNPGTGAGSFYNALSRDNLSDAGRSTGPADPANPAVRLNRVNIVDLPGGPGYSGLDGMGPYDELLWSAPGSRYASAWDTGRAAVLQQPVKNTNLVTRGTFKFGEHRLIAEAVLGRSESTKSFSPNQISTASATSNSTLPNGTVIPNPFRNLGYPSTGADYNRVFNALAAFLPEILPNRGQPLFFRWRAIPAGNREFSTRSDTNRFLVGAEGPLGFLSQWDYRIGASQAKSKSSSTLISGYFYQQGFADLLNRGILNPFSYTQTPEALTALDKVRANGVKLYGGTFTTNNADFVATGPIFRLPAGQIMSAVGVDWRQEKYFFAGDQRPNANTVEALIFNAPFDNSLATAGTLKRTIKAGFAELQIPIFKGLDLNPAVRSDEYTGFGRTTNPKVTLRFAPSDKFLVRSTYSTGFRVPTFKQMFDPTTLTTYAGNDIADPAAGTNGVVTPNAPAVKPDILGGGKRDLQPEEATMYSAGFVVAPTRHISANVDWWSVEREGQIRILGLTDLVRNYALFGDRFIRNPAGTLTAVDTRWVNSGTTRTSGVEFGVKGDTDVRGGKLSAGFDLSYLLEKKSKLLASAPFGRSEIGQFTRSSDLGIRWKHTASIGYRKGNWSVLANQTYRGGYVDAILPGVANGTVKPVDWQAKVKPYDIYGLSVTYRGLKNMTVIAGIKNLFNSDPPFSATYDTNTGAGSSWEPRVADPRGRSYTLRVDYKFQ
ncbi:TonB-dependent receptor domain-containing protein [Horticoccus sp. 23ND18S-11]|uniref:TonB-dependent receptor domain-containing protein n=1 Tax=Horticoccus sp. 23ND18S-11 TaxID=3391832 RepID=UPI0039C997E3